MGPKDSLPYGPYCSVICENKAFSTNPSSMPYISVLGFEYKIIKHLVVRPKAFVKEFKKKKKTWKIASHYTIQALP